MFEEIVLNCIFKYTVISTENLILLRFMLVHKLLLGFTLSDLRNDDAYILSVQCCIIVKRIVIFILTSVYKTCDGMMYSITKCYMHLSSRLMTTEIVLVTIIS